MKILLSVLLTQSAEKSFQALSICPQEEFTFHREKLERVKGKFPPILQYDATLVDYLQYLTIIKDT